MTSYGVTIQMKATEQCFPVVLFIMLYKVVLKLLNRWMIRVVMQMQFISLWKVARVDKIPLKRKNHWMFVENLFLLGINVVCSLE